ncbi:hypothetical protein [Acinetobacter baylyi]|uniref:Uncharacterized protein n=2 Tax=Acinetobacter baylyi TaxID=202950 RepID=Q6F757_ACIAD|nr:hypothetical protein [Acinetobacter baylyi]UXJ58003.1 hypothetical protein N5P16_03015 [Acinetobacter baylyi]CAG70108.1 hypothetical protein ACIAD3456 [Acinetobacter baylyi ADP1]
MIHSPFFIYMTKKIKDNESIKPLINLLKVGQVSFKALDKFPFIYKLNPKAQLLKEKFLKIQDMSNILYLPDQFNEIFAKHGWICYGALSQKVLEESVKLGLENKIDEAKKTLIDSIDEIYIDLILIKCQSREHFKLRIDLLTLLKTDYLEKRYHACIPLLLAIIDGLANDISNHIGFFTESSQFELYDSITAHSSGLPFLKEIMNSSRKATNIEEITIPYRNGILHGRDLNFANKEVASKCWWVLAALIEWADERRINKQKNQESFLEILQSYNQTSRLNQRIDSWEKRTRKGSIFWQNQTTETLEKSSPEYTLLEFLQAWKNKQWGKLTPTLLHTIGKHQKKETKDIKVDYSSIDLLNFYIINSNDQSPSSTIIKTHLDYIKDRQNFIKEVSISLNYAHQDNGLPELRNEPNGKWFISQNSLSEILF